MRVRVRVRVSARRHPTPTPTPTPSQVLSKFTRMRGLGLPQPHEKRTGLCELEPQKMSAEYRAGMPRCWPAAWVGVGVGLGLAPARVQRWVGHKVST